MSAARLRAPASWHRVARAEARALLASRGLILLMAVAVVLSVLPSRSDYPFPWAPVANFLQIMFIFPVLYWRGAGGARALDQAAPMGPVRYELIRFAVGAAAALVVLCTVALAHAWTAIPDFNPAALETLPRGYAVALVIRGLALYGYGSIAVLRGRGQGLGPVLLGSVLVMMMVQAAGGGSLQTGSATDAHPPGQPGIIISYTASLTLQTALTELAVAVAAVCAFAWYGSRERSRPRLPWESAQIDATPSPHASRGRRVLPSRRKPASLPRIIARQFVIHAPRMMLWPAYALLTALFSALGSIRQGHWPPDFFDAGGYVLLFAAFFWPLLVRADGHRSDWEHALPTGVLAQRLLHWGVGLAWLQLWTLLVVVEHAAGERAKGSPVGAPELLELPLAVLGFYCLGTLPAMIKKHPVGWSIVAWMVTMRELVTRVDEVEHSGALSPVRLFAPLLSDEAAWSTPASLFWIPVLVTVALTALHFRVRWDRRAPALPSVRAVRLRPHRT